MIFENVLMPYILATHHHLVHISCLLTSICILCMYKITVNPNIINACNISSSNSGYIPIWWINQPNAAFYWMMCNNILNLLCNGVVNILKHRSQKQSRNISKYEIKNNNGYINMAILITVVFSNLFTTMIG